MGTYGGMGGYNGMASYGMGGYGGMGGGYGGMGYGGMGGMGMGMAPGFDPNNASLTQQLEATTHSTFALIQSIVQTFGGFAQMLESTFMATHSSFFAMVGVADQFVKTGDFSHSRAVNVDDQISMDVGFNTGRTGYSNGDLNYSWHIDFDDYVAMDLVFGSTLAEPL